MSLNYKINKFILRLFYNNLKSNRVLIYIFFYWFNHQLSTFEKSSVERLSPFLAVTPINLDNGLDQVCTIPVGEPGWYLNTGSDVTVGNTSTQNQSFKSHPS
jgi:hypothetical protein